MELQSHPKPEKEEPVEPEQDHHNTTPSEERKIAFLQLPSTLMMPSEHPEPNFRWEILPDNYLVYGPADDVPGGPDQAMISFTCYCGGQGSPKYCICHSK